MLKYAKILNYKLINKLIKQKRGDNLIAATISLTHYSEISQDSIRQSVCI